MSFHFYQNQKTYSQTVSLPNLSGSVVVDAGKYVSGDPADSFQDLVTAGLFVDTGTSAPTPSTLVVFTQNSGSSSGTVGGSLAGSLPNPTIAAGAVGTTELANLGVTTAKIAAGAVGTTELAATAVTNAVVSSSAAIAFSKLAALTSGNILVGNGSNVATSVALSGDATLSNAGVLTIGAGKVTPTKVNFLAAAPLSGDPGTAGELIFASGFLYCCISSGVWQRVALTGSY